MRIFRIRKRLFWALSVLPLLIAVISVVTVVVRRANAAACPCTIFTSNPSPGTSNDAGGLEVGMKFKSTTTGYVTGVRFYKVSPATMGGTHSGSLWDANGNRITSVEFTNETASGWQEASFPSPVGINANTIYTISVFNQGGGYAHTSGYFANPATNGSLTAPASGSADAADNMGNMGQGVFNSGNVSAYPSSTFGQTNYWIDVVFFDTSAPAVTTVSPADGAQGVIVGDGVSVTFDQGMDDSTITASTFEVKDGQGTAVAGTYSYNSSTKTASFLATDGLATNTTYTATINGGTSGVKNQAGVALPADHSWNFTTAATNDCPCSLKNGANPAGSSSFDESGGNELGIKIRPSTNGYISAIRFYKPLSSTETTHTGNIWSANGTNLATTTFTNESDYGWQEAKLNSPLRVYSGQTYIVSYGTVEGVYQATGSALNSNISNGYLTAFATGASENAASGSGNQNGVYFTSAGGYPQYGSPNGTYYWVDAIFSVESNNTIPLQIDRREPQPSAFGVPTGDSVRATFNRILNGATVTNSTVRLFDSSNNQISGNASYDSGMGQLSFTPSSTLANGQTYTVRLDASIADANGLTLGQEQTWSFTTGSALSTDPAQGPGGPVLVVTSASNKYSTYYTEILRTEGLNHFSTADISTVTASSLASYKAVVLAEMPLTQGQADMLNAWVQEGGDLIAMKPDKKLTGLLGLTDEGTTQTHGYLKTNNANTLADGIVTDTIQFKGTADAYTTDAANVVATLYSDASTATSHPAVTSRSVGSKGGTAAAFTYDLAKSTIALHQGNQAWVGQNRDGLTPNRSDDLYFGAASGDNQPDWIDLNKIHIPQTDEQQRLLANIIIENTKDGMPLPRFWYLPYDHKAAMVLAMDDHGSDNQLGVQGAFSRWLTESTANCSLAKWECIRSSAYTYPSSALTPARARQFHDLGFEIGSHPSNGCSNFTSYSDINDDFDAELNAWRTKYTNIPNQKASRFHCYVWSDWDSMARAELNHGIRYSLEYVAYPPTWIGTRAPAAINGTSMNMRFTDADGDLLDVYQGVTNFDNTVAASAAINTVLDNAIGATGYYGLFGTHYDVANTYDVTLFASAKARNVPMISAEQALTWLDGRNSSAFNNVSGGNGRVTFTLAAAEGAQGLRSMMPFEDAAGTITSITRNEENVSYQTQTIKGIQYAVFDGWPGDYVVTYSDYNPSTPDNGNGGQGSSGSGSTGGTSNDTAAERKAATNRQLHHVLEPEPEEEIISETPQDPYTDDPGNFGIDEGPEPKDDKQAEGTRTSSIVKWIFVGLLLVAAIIAGWWLVAAARRRRSSDDQY